MVAPVLDELAAAHPNLKVAKVDVDAEQDLAMQYRITSIPPSSSSTRARS